MKLKLWKHPVDWILHGIGCFLLVASGAVVWWAMIILGAYLEYEQKSLVSYYKLTWRNYVVTCALGDFVFDCIGVLVGVIIRLSV